MKIIHYKKMYLPALSIVAVISMLFILIGVSTYKNLNRDKKRAMEFVHGLGALKLRFIEIVLEKSSSLIDNHKEVVDRIFQETAANNDVEYIYIHDSNGIILKYPESYQVLDIQKNTAFESDKQIKKRLRELQNGSEIFELSKSFLYFKQPHENGKRDEVIVIGMNMKVFETARQSDFHHAIMMVGILVVLGSGAFFFLFVIQNYYLVGRTLRQTEDYTRQVVANMANGLLSIDSDGKVASYNHLALDLLDIDESEIDGFSLRGVFDFDKTGIQDTLIKSSSVMDFEIAYEKKSGEILPLALSVTPIPGNKGDSSGAVIVIRDLREIKSLQNKVKRAEKLAAVGKIAAGIAHEIRNPLSSIKGFAGFLQHSLKDRPQDREYAEVMVKELDRINRVVSDLLVYARPLKPELSPTQIDSLIEHTILLVKPDSQTKEIDVHTNFPVELPEVMIDPNQMKQAILNLVLNALDAAEKGGTVEIGADFDETAGNLHMWVEDNGKGISPDILDKIFDPYFTKREKGTGLGLPIVNKITEIHNGEIRVESPPPGKAAGSRFTITVPFKTEKEV